jgi:hypothetical protein
MKPCGSNRRNSGQVLIIASLIITLLLLSTALYITETEKDALVYHSETDTNFSAYKLGTMHTLISALANISNDGTSDILIADLNQFNSITADHSYNAIFKVEYTPLGETPYQNGIWIDWNSSGRGISSAYVSFRLNSSGTSAIYHSEYAVNITTELDINGYYSPLTGSLKQVNVTARLLNEGRPALASNFTIYYENDGSLSQEEWMRVASPGITDYGNGTYSMSFTAETVNPTDPLLISVQCHDLRYIFIEANATCVQV